MILILASPEDLCARETVARLKHCGHEVCVVSEAELHGALQVRWELGNGCDSRNSSYSSFPSCTWERIRERSCTSQGGAHDRRSDFEPPSPVLSTPPTGQPFATSRLRVILSSGVWDGSLDEVTGVLVRVRRSFLADLAKDDDAHYIQMEWAAFLFGFLNALPCPVLNRPRPGAGQRLPESRRVTEALKCSGLHAPRTLVTASAPAAAEFFERNGRRVICASPGLARGLPLEGDRGREALSAATNRSIRLQAVPEGRWMRVFIVGGEAFAEACEAVEYGWTGTGMDEECFGPAVANSYVKLAASLDLPFVELLSLSTEDGRQCVYSVNDFPDIERCAPPRRAQITEALAKVLAQTQGRGLR